MSEISRKSVDTMRKVASLSSYFSYGFTSLYVPGSKLYGCFIRTCHLGDPDYDSVLLEGGDNGDNSAVRTKAGVYIFLFDPPPRVQKYGQITCRGKKDIQGDKKWGKCIFFPQLLKSMHIFPQLT